VLASSRAGTLLRALTMLVALGAVPSHALDAVVPDVDLARLPPIASGHRDANPYRGNPAAIEIGRTAYAQACARCHGVDATQIGPAADLRRIGGYCGRLTDPALRERCVRDADAYFGKAIREGRVRLGIRHMPAWADRMPAPLAWAIQSYVESRRER
jgi:mono/diheme cytochrome c family protein